MNNLLQKECVTYNQAKKLQELGFNDSHCFGFYNQMGELNLNESAVKNEKMESLDVPAPTYQGAFRWIREKFGLHHLPLMERFYIDRGFTFETAESKSLDELLKNIEASKEIETSI